MTTRMRILRYVRPYWGLVWVSLGLVVVAGLVDVATPWPLQILIDNVLQSHPPAPAVARVLGPLAADRGHLLLVAVGAGLLLAILAGLVSVADNYASTRL